MRQIGGRGYFIARQNPELRVFRGQPGDALLLPQTVMTDALISGRCESCDNIP
jgi:hypothetical protein